MLKIAFNSIYKLPLPEGHRFPMEKYELIPEQLLHEGIIEECNLFNPNKIKDLWLKYAHDTEYIDKLNQLNLSKSEVRKTGFPLTRELIEREYIITEGTKTCVDYAIKYGISANIAGGTHHAFRNKGEGFCLFNDVAVASYYAIKKHKLKSILIIDLDVHQGNGTASIFSNNDHVFTFSMHGKNNYPFKKETSTLDIELQDGTSDLEYLSALNNSLSIITQRFSPQIIFYISGVDILSTDKLGRLNISKNGCKNRDEIVYEYALKTNSPIITSMGGGYSENINDIVEAHCNTFKCMSFLV